LAASKEDARSQVSFKDKAITMIVTTSPGGGNDAVGRLIARFLQKYLPGGPSVVVQNLPGANETIATIHFLTRTEPNGLALLVGSSTPVDPIVFRASAVRYDPRTLVMIGGVGRGGSIIFVTSEAEPRLYDKSAAPVVIGSVGAMPRSAMQPAIWSIEYLGWNAKWVTGYSGTNESMLAFDRGEIDMTSTGNMFQIKDRLESGRLKIVVQTGMLVDGRIVGRPDYGDAPLFTDQMKGKIVDKTAQQAFDYWLANNNLDKWVALAPGTPEQIVESYRTAFRRMAADSDFMAFGEQIGEGFTPTTAADVEQSVRTLAETPPAALDYIKGVMRKQGLRIN
jgi:tripartite-type tricarboxylate transporter receptor subunit TctC